MKIKKGWQNLRGEFRAKEIQRIFADCPENAFHTGLEIGAGDGIQSTLLTKYISKLISTDINPNRLTRESTESIDYRICDAEEIAEIFDKQKFDIVFSSNLLEHLPNSQKAIKDICRVLKDDGITINIMPSPFFAFCLISLYIPNQVVRIVERITEKGGTKWFIHKVRGFKEDAAVEQSSAFDNNPKTMPQKRPFIRKLLIPPPHGISQSIAKELFMFRQRRWIREFERADFSIEKIIKGPVSSGYGFGWDSLSKLAEMFGLTSEYIYIATKKGYKSQLARHF
jgi:SAM-dependent methyltransferase